MSWKRATALAVVWVTAMTVILVGTTMLMEVWTRMDTRPVSTRNKVPVWCYLGMFPVILLTFFKAPSLSGRIHRSRRVAKLVGILSIVGVLLAILVWLKPFFEFMTWG